MHEDSAPLRRMAVFDVVVNNADRKGGHVLAMADGHRYGVDHGVTFHVEHKLRTVLWGWVGEPLDRRGAGRPRACSPTRSTATWASALGDLLTPARGRGRRRRRVAAAAAGPARAAPACRHPLAAVLSGRAIPWPPF